MVDRVKFKDTEVSRLGLGNMRLPCKTIIKREANPLIDYEKSQKIVDMAFENGVNYFDTAYMYHAGKSEKFIGTALKKYPRESYFLADKLPIWMCNSPKDMQKIFNKQLERTGIDRFDFYLLHSLDGKNFDKCEKYGAYDFLLEKREEGLINNIGFSFHGTIDDLKRIVAAHHWDFAQIQMNYLDWENQDAKTQYQILTDADIPVIVMEPVRGGKLADVPDSAKEIFKKNAPDKSIASWAIRFVASFPNVITILSGMNSLEQMEDNLSSLTDFVPMTDTELNICKNVASIINEKEIIACTGCDYCVECPKQIKISTVFDYYNQFKNDVISKEKASEQIAAVDATYTECIRCNKCKQHCPQGLDIPELFATKINALF
ncbi:MAG: aldo/keto reductase [Eubacterium sp.]